jgi:hypothetical protein
MQGAGGCTFEQIISFCFQNRHKGLAAGAAALARAISWSMVALMRAGSFEFMLRDKRSIMNDNAMVLLECLIL